MNCKNHCCNQFGERDLMQKHIDDQAERIAKLLEENMLLRQELDQKDERVFAANKCRSRNEHFDGYKLAQDLMEGK